MENHNIEVIGELSTSPVTHAQILDILKSALSVSVQKGSSFEGRPTTQLLITDDYVIKLRTELRFSQRDAKRWIEKQLASEKAYCVYHPSKTWFLLHQEDGNPIIANICKHLTPVNVYCAGTQAPSSWHSILGDILNMYLKCAVKYERALDDGLSNYGLDENQLVYYLDDETYEANQLVSLSHGLAVWVRQLTWLDEKGGAWLGKYLHSTISRYFDDPHWLFVLRAQFSDAFFAEGRQRTVATAILNHLTPKKQKKTTVLEAMTLDTQQPIALLGDIHSNYPALVAVLKHLEEMNIQQGIILGDIVGYGPHPNECISVLRDLNWPIIKGNHDHGLSIMTSTQGFSKNALKVLEWTATQVSDDDKSWLLNLPPYLEFDNCMAVHGAPMDIHYMYGYVYAMTYEENLDAVLAKNKRLCFHGHSHIQGVYYRKRGQSFESKAPKTSFKNVESALICPGSVGQPRGGRQGAEFAIYYPIDDYVQFYNIKYDIKTVLEKMSEEDFPAPLLSRLLEGT